MCRKNRKEAGEKAGLLSERYMLHKPEDLSLIPITHGKSQVQWYEFIIPELGSARREDPWGSLVS